ncbi:MAG: hypothetical protein ACU85V_11525 [Gammaproteobacteria bacterium]
MKATLELVLARLDALKLQERVLLLVAFVAVTGMLFLEFAFDPMAEERRQLGLRVAALNNRIADNDMLTAQIIEASQRDLNQPLRTQLEQTNTAIARFEGEIRERAGELVAPELMPEILRGVLERIDGLAFASFEGLGPQPLLNGEHAPGEDDTGANAIRHGFRISFRGSYLDTIAYLRALEAMPYRFFWDSVDIEVDEHPDADVSIEVYTLSLERRWIGV